MGPPTQAPATAPAKMPPAAPAEDHGVVTVLEAEDIGVPAVEVRKLAYRGALKSYGKGVYGHLDVPADELP